VAGEPPERDEAARPWPAPGTVPALAVAGRTLAATALAPVWLMLVAGLLFMPLGTAGVPLAAILAFAAPPLVLARRHGGARRFLALHAASPRAIAGAVLIGASLWLVVLVALGPLLQLLPDHALTEERLAPMTDPSTPLALRLAMFAAVPAIAEELLCRGVLCRQLAARWGATAGIGVAALYFAALHMSLTQGFSVLVIGLALGAVALRTGSTITAMILHFVNNAAVILVAAPELVLGDALIEPRSFAVAVVAAVGCLTVGILLVRRSADPGIALPSARSLP
jgi:membrane protease YdiL (CAAX protease family)